MNKAQALFLAELVKDALASPELMILFRARVGTYGEELAREGLTSLKESFQLSD